MCIDNGSLRQAEGNIGNAQDRMAVKFIAHAAQGLQGRQGALRVRGNGHRKTVDHDVLTGYSVPVCSLINLFCDRDTAVCRLRDPVLIQHQAHNYAAVFSDQGEDSLNALFFAVYGIHHGLAVVKTHAVFHGNRVRSIDLQGQGQDALESGDDCRHHLRFIDFRKAHIDIQNMGAAVLLIESLCQDIFDVIFPQSLFKLLFPGGIDPLADNDRLSADFHRPGEGGDHCQVFLCIRNKRNPF